MKNIVNIHGLKLIIITVIILVQEKFAFSQIEWHTIGNVVSDTEYIGVNTTSTIPLEIKTIPSLNINFSPDWRKS